MPTCDLCSTYFSTRVTIEGKVHILSSRKYCLSCSPFKKHNTRRILSTDEAALMWDASIKRCAKCKTPQAHSEFYSRGKGVQSWCKTCVKNNSAQRARELKLAAIDHLGGVCKDCRQMPHPAAMTFHHLDPAKKDFSISHARYRKGIEDVRSELEKCVLLCMNCHAIRHAALAQG